MLLALFYVMLHHQQELLMVNVIMTLVIVDNSIHYYDYSTFSAL